MLLMSEFLFSNLWKLVIAAGYFCEMLPKHCVDINLTNVNTHLFRLKAQQFAAAEITWNTVHLLSVEYQEVPV